MHLNWLEKIELRRCAEPPGRQYYLLLITVVRKNAKGTENEETRLFCQIFVIVAFPLKGPGPPGPPPSHAYDFEIRSRC